MASAKPAPHPSFERMVLADDPFDATLVENCHPPTWTNPMR